MEDMAMTDSLKSSDDFWREKRVLLTGHTGFKGAWLTQWLNKLGANVTGVSLPPEASPNLYTLAKIDNLCQSHFCDIRDAEAIATIIKQAQPEIVFHLAAQALVLPSYQNPIETFASNIMGTVHVLDALRGLDCVQVAVMVTTDKVYRNKEWFWPYREDDHLGGHDPYSASKAASEIVIASYRDAFLSSQGVAVASARAGNVIGGGDWSEHRLIPDAVRAWEIEEPLDIRQPQAIRPWQHVLEPLAGYLTMAHKLWHNPELAGAYNFGPETGTAATVRDVIELACATFGSGKINYVTGSEGSHEANWLTLETAKARVKLGIHAKFSLTEAVQQTMAWYRAQHEGADARKLCMAEIAAYEAML